MHTDLSAGKSSATTTIVQHTPQAEGLPDEAAGSLEVIRRNGKLTPFDASKIEVALCKAFLAVEKGQAAASSRIHETVARLSGEVIRGLLRHRPDGAAVHIELIQDQVELVLMRGGYHKIARAYVLYREEQARKRGHKTAHTEAADSGRTIHLKCADGGTLPLDLASLQQRVKHCCLRLENVSDEHVLEQLRQNLFDGMTEQALGQALVLSARNLIELDPNYAFVTARLLLGEIGCEARGRLDLDYPLSDHDARSEHYADYFAAYIEYAVDQQLLDAELQRYDLAVLGDALVADRDLQFNYLGLQTLYDRYLIHSQDDRIELPQAFFMRVAMGLAINEIDREQRAIEFYHLLSAFDFMCSTPTLFNSATRRPQLSSCYLSTVPDDLDGIYSAIRDNALLSKFAGGLGNDWTPVRGLGAHIKGTHGSSQGVVPFLKVANDTAVAVNQGGKRKGAVCAYLESWHIDIEEFLELRKNTGDERRRTHDMNTANWVPDLFMQRVAAEGDWTLFSPDEVSDLHELTGQAFRERYEAYERRAQRGELRVWKQLPAQQLWRKMLGALFETGHPWITFKDPCNLRYTNQHKGVVHSSNLCTEITLHTSNKEIAVCNLGSINLAAHVDADGLDMQRLERSVQTAMRMLDNVIDYNYYAVAQARNSNLRHRPVGLGLMGFQDALYKLNLSYQSEAALEFADRSMEAVSYFAIKASTDLAEERGRYSDFEGSLWSRGMLPIDSLSLLKQQRGDDLACDTGTTLDWERLRTRVTTLGMRNSNCLAIAPTATIANICGVSQSIEPTYQNLFVKSNLSGEFTLTNPYLVDELKQHNLWDEVMVNDLKYYDGSVQPIQRIPEAIKQKYATAFEVDARWLVEAAARRQKWIDQSQSLNLYVADPDGPKLDALYRLAWLRGLKTTYYLRTLAATQVEKTAHPLDAVDRSPSQGSDTPLSCAIHDPDCEACQ